MPDALGAMSYCRAATDGGINGDSISGCTALVHTGVKNKHPQKCSRVMSHQIKNDRHANRAFLVIARAETPKAEEPIGTVTLICSRVEMKNKVFFCFFRPTLYLI